MEANRARRRWTYAEFARLPSEGGKRREIIDGQLHVTPSPSAGHQRIVTRLVSVLHGFVQANDLGEVFAGPLDVLLAEGDYLEPDVLFVAAGRAHLVSDRGVEGPPDLVVEVVSPSTADRDRGIKLERYRAHGVGEYWIIDPEAGTIEVWRLSGATRRPSVLGPADTLRWTPLEGAAALEIAVSALLDDPRGESATGD